MKHLGLKFLTLFLTIGIAGAAPLCACVMQILQADQHACCDDNSKSPTQSKDCSSCGQMQATANRASQSSPAVSTALFTTLPVIAQPLPQIDLAIATVEHSTAPPPLLLDLVHTSCQLTV